MIVCTECRGITGKGRLIESKQVKDRFSEEMTHDPKRTQEISRQFEGAKGIPEKEEITHKGTMGNIFLSSTAEYISYS